MLAGIFSRLQFLKVVRSGTPMQMDPIPTFLLDDGYIAAYTFTTQTCIQLGKESRRTLS